MARPSRIGEAARERGLRYDQALRVAYFPGPPATWKQYSRRQLDEIRDEAPPFATIDDASTAATWRRTQIRKGRNVGAEDILASAELRAIITVLRHDAIVGQYRDRRTEREARQFAWALRLLHGKPRVDFAGYMRRRK